MLALAEADGTTAIVGTPHSDGHAPDVSMVVERKVYLEMAARERGLSIDVHVGFELALSPSLADLGASASQFGLAGSHYLLVELPLAAIPLYAHDALFRLQASGLQLILAHAERYAPVLDDENVAADFVRRGLLLQVNSDSILGSRGRHVARRTRGLIGRGLVSFLASDAHSPVQRPPGLRAAANEVIRLVGADAVEALVRVNATAVLADAPLPPQPPIRRRRFFA